MSKTFQGVPCKWGHSGWRYIVGHGCVECARIIVRRYQATPKGRATIEKYVASPRRSAALKKYNASEKARAADAKYRKTEKSRLSQRKYDQTPRGILARTLRDRVRKIIKRGRGVRAGSAIADLGCSIAEFRFFIEQQFRPGMNWENYGEWHLDHIKPLKLFDLTDRQQFLEACHFSNYQPLWAFENLSKAAKFAEAA